MKIHKSTSMLMQLPKHNMITQTKYYTYMYSAVLFSI